jgi:hypothetical protein
MQLTIQLIHELFFGLLKYLLQVIPFGTVLTFEKLASGELSFMVSVSFIVALAITVTYSKVIMTLKINISCAGLPLIDYFIYDKNKIFEVFHYGLLRNGVPNKNGVNYSLITCKSMPKNRI